MNFTTLLKNNPQLIELEGVALERLVYLNDNFFFVVSFYKKRGQMEHFAARLYQHGFYEFVVKDFYFHIYLFFILLKGSHKQLKVVLNVAVKHLVGDL